MRRRAGRTVLVVLMAAVVAGCSLPTQAAARQTVAAVPVPAGAIVLEETSQFGPLGVRSYSIATRVYALPLPVESACPAAVRAVLDVGYTVVLFQDVTGPTFTDPEAACAADLAVTRRVNGDPTLTALAGSGVDAFAPGVPPQNPNRHFFVYASGRDPRSPYPGGSTLRVAST